MHVAEGALSGPVLLAGATVALAGVGMGLKKMDYEDVPRVAVLASAFFVASLIHVPIGPSSTHLVLNGLAGLILGWAVFPALAVALFLQAVIFGYGGLTALGVNVAIMAGPGVVCHYLFRSLAADSNPKTAFAAGFGAGALGVALGCLGLSLSLYLSAQSFLGAAKLVLLAHLPVMVIEGLIVGSVVVFLNRVRPDLNPGPARRGV